MMMYCIHFDTDQQEILIGILSAFPFEGFQEFDDHIEAYIPAEEWEALSLKIIRAAGDAGELTGAHVLPEINWNATWEASFQPVTIDHFCAVRASFHQPVEGVEHEIIIDPKMAFGTGHHETTELMMRAMRKLDMTGKSILDMGCGTGILAILAARCGAQRVLAVDNDPEAVANAIDNAAINYVDVICLQGTASDLPAERFDIVLANINKNTLIRIMPDLKRVLDTSGVLLLSGILLEDRQAIVAAAEEIRLSVKDSRSKGEWLCLQFSINDR